MGLSRPRCTSSPSPGAAEDCAAAVRRRADAGADAVVLVPAGADPADQVARFAAEVMPQLAG